MQFQNSLLQISVAVSLGDYFPNFRRIMVLL